MWSKEFLEGYRCHMEIFLRPERRSILPDEMVKGYHFAKSMVYNSLGTRAVPSAPISFYNFFKETQPTPKQMLEFLHEVWGSHLCPTIGREMSCDEDLCPFCEKENTYRGKP